jgi:antitoxin component YwqK of YwqJK toxin-antitoxin module
MKVIIQFLCQIKFLVVLILIISSCQDNKIEELIQNVPELKVHDQPVIQGETMNGKREGKWTSFFPNGKIQSECYYVDGLNHGATKVYLENGKLLYEGEYVNGAKAGNWTFLDLKSGAITKKKY